MTTGDPAPAHLPPEVPPRRSWRGSILLCAVLGVFGATEYVAATAMGRDPLWIRLPLSIVAMVAVALVFAAVGLWIRIAEHWALPARRLARSLELLLAGELPVERFPGPAGGLRLLQPHFEALLRELRARRAEITRLNCEMRQRVAQRTDALERMIGSLRAQAARDPLTGLSNRRSLEHCLDEVVQRCASANQPLCVLMIDIDDFKLLNDTLGHAAGDEFLRSVGQLVRSTARSSDLAFRLGGDEFIILMPGADAAQGEALARRLVELVDGLARPLPVARKPRLSVGRGTLSPGAGLARGEQLLAAADQELYAAKSLHKSAQAPRAA